MRTSVFSVIALASIAAATAAQDKPYDQPKTTTPPASTTRPTTPTAVVTHTPARGSKLIGANIVDASDKTLGEIEDLLFCESGEIIAFVDRDSGGKICMPLAALQPKLETKKADEGKAAPTTEVDKFLFVGDAAVLASAEDVKDVASVDATSLKRCREHFGLTAKAGDKDKPGDERKPGNLPGDTAGGAAKPGETPKDMAERTAYAKPTCLKKLLGEDVKDATGKDIGDVKDVAVNLDHSQVAYVVISTGGMLDSKLHGVALDKLQATADGKGVNLPLSEDAVKAAGHELDLDRLPAQPALLAGTVPSKS